MDGRLLGAAVPEVDDDVALAEGGEHFGVGGVGACKEMDEKEDEKHGWLACVE